jgi:hypothetical protein
MLPSVLAFLDACASAPPPVLPPDERPLRPDRDGEIVALYNGEPLRWREVAEKTLELDLKNSVDQYVRWKIVEDRRRALGILTPPEEVRRRAETFLRQTRKSFEGGEAAFRAELTRQGFTEESYLEHLAGLRYMRETLTLEKIVRYQGMVEDAVEIDRMIFADEGDAKRFVEECAAAGFDRAAEEIGKKAKNRIGRRPRETFRKSAPPGPPEAPALDPWILEAVLRLKPGEATGVEASRSNLYYVIRLLSVRPGRDVAYADVRGEVLESVLADPPREEECKRWVQQEFSRGRLEYGAGRRER